MAPSNLFTIYPGEPMADTVAAHLLQAHAPQHLAHALILLPTRRACSLMRQAFMRQAGGRNLLLPRMLSLADVEQELPGLLSELTEMAAIPPAMPHWQRMSLLVQQVRAFETQRSAVGLLDYTLALAEDLVALQDAFTRADIALDAGQLAGLAPARYAEHWQQTIAFLSIICAHWPQVEEEAHAITRAGRETRMLQLLAATWRTHPPDFPVVALGSTASQRPTANLLQVIAELPQGQVILPGVDTRISEEEWGKVAAGHPYFHLKQFMDQCAVGLPDIQPLGCAPEHASAWGQVLCDTALVAAWHDASPLVPEQYKNIRIVECAHHEEEARVAALLLRELAEQPQQRMALIAPDVAFLDRVAAHLEGHGITADRLQRGTVGQTETGSLWLALVEAIVAPERMLAQMALLRHPLVRSGSAGEWRDWLTQAEPYFHGLVTHAAGQLPRLPETLDMREESRVVGTLLHQIHQCSRQRKPASEWVAALQALLQTIAPEVGEAAEQVEELLDALAPADALGALQIEDFYGLLRAALREPWRGNIHDANPNISLLTPIEARLQPFDHVVLANMQDDVWPGIRPAGAWLNHGQQVALGLPSPEEQMSLMAHDVLLLGSAPAVTLTYARRDRGAPVARSRFVERLVARLAVQGVPEEQLHARQYVVWAQALQRADDYQPATTAMPTPSATQRPRELPVSALDRLFVDPYFIYARHVLGLREHKSLDEEPEIKDFGSLAHRAIQQLSEHWNTHLRAADAAELDAMADHALRHFSDRANIRLFWRTRLVRALLFVNQHEAERRAQQAELLVRSEVTLSEAVLPNLTLHGRIDRLEEGATGAIISDYKTGSIPTPKEMQEGKAVQLLAYAMMLEAAGTPVAGVDYWQLPHGKAEGEISRVMGEEIEASALLEKLRNALQTFLDPSLPLLARPIRTAQGERQENPYDGISRYDEWA